MKKIRIKYFRDEITLKDIDRINQIEAGDWIDLRAATDVTMKAGEYRAIPLGVAMELPKG